MGKHVNKRPGIRTPEIDRRILQGLRRGVPLAVLCREKGMPSRQTVNRWENKSKVFASRIARAREDGYDRIAFDCFSIADNAGSDVRFGAKSMFIDHDHISRSKLRIWTRLELLKKWDPKRYGDLLKLGDPTGNKLVPPALKIGLVGGPVKTVKEKPKAKPAPKRK